MRAAPLRSIVAFTATFPAPDSSPSVNRSTDNVTALPWFPAVPCTSFTLTSSEATGTIPIILLAIVDA